MKFRIIISPAASKDVDRLEAWLLDKDPGAAIEVGVVLERAIASLDELPERGRPLASGMRELASNLVVGDTWCAIRSASARSL